MRARTVILENPPHKQLASCFLETQLFFPYPSTEGHQQTVFEAQKPDFGSLFSRFLIISLFGPSAFSIRARSVVMLCNLQSCAIGVVSTWHDGTADAMGRKLGLCWHGLWPLESQGFRTFHVSFFLGGLIFGSSQSWDLQLIV